MGAGREFESETCGRCGGSGRHSWNARYLDICFGCGGSGRKLTKTGAEAAEIARAARTVRADELTPGTLVLVESFGGVKRSGKPVEAVRPDPLNPGYLQVDFSGLREIVPPGRPYILADRESRERALKVGLDWQDKAIARRRKRRVAAPAGEETPAGGSK